jgi:DNA gyrase subunit A
MGDYIPAKLGMDSGEKPIFMRVQNEYPDNESLVFIFENGKGVKIPLSSYDTKGNRRKLVGAYSDASPIVGVLHEASEPIEILMVNSANKAISFKSSLITTKTTRTANGSTLMTLKKGQKVVKITTNPGEIEAAKGCRKTKLPATGSPLSSKKAAQEQIEMDI